MPRIHLPGGYFHVILRGNGRQDVFFSTEDRTIWEEILATGLDRYGHRLHAYCWMTNHLHMAMQAGDQPLGHFMRYVASRYARGCNRRQARPGHLFERRYRAILVQHDSYLLELVRYIHLNPVRAHMVDKLRQYPWSSHAAYSGGRCPDWLTTEQVLRMFAAFRNQAYARYRTFMNEAPRASVLERLRAGNEHDGRILGDDEWIRLALAGTDATTAPCSLDELIANTCAQQNISVQALYSKSRVRKLSRVRAEIALAATERNIATLSEVAHRLRRAHSTLSRAVQRLRERGV